MATPDLNGGALAGVRLTQVPLKIRRRYGGVLLDRALKELDPIAAVQFAAELEKAVEHPSDRLYWVAASEIKRVLR